MTLKVYRVLHKGSGELKEVHLLDTPLYFAKIVPTPDVKLKKLIR